MAEEQVQGAEQAGEGTAPKKGASKLLLPIIVAVATLAGGVVGVTVVAPRLIAARATSAEPADSAAEGEHGGEGGEPRPLLKMDNLIVNPAGAQGTRFLMVSVAVEAPTPKVGDELRAQELRIRDLIIGLLERQTMQDLSTPGIREDLKGQIADTIGALMGQAGKIRVLLPQFVVQ
jgi:flagellar protein FliL